jgi:hypothetical protein
VTTSAELPGLAIAALVVERFGRLASMKYSVLLCGVAMMGLATQPSMEASTGTCAVSRTPAERKLAAERLLQTPRGALVPRGARQSTLGCALSPMLAHALWAHTEQRCGSWRAPR